MAKRLDEKESSGIKIEDGVFAKLYTVESIEDQSSYPGKVKKFFKSGKETNLALNLSLVDEDGRAAYMFLMGWFKKNEKTDEVTDWDPFLNRMNRFLAVVNPDLEYIEDDLSVAHNNLLKYIGKKIYIIIYYSNKSYENKDGILVPNSWNRWDFVFPETATVEEMSKAWFDGKAYIKDLALATYAANQESKKYAEKEKESFNYGANAKDDPDQPVKKDII